jgi:hypothetical protein
VAGKTTHLLNRNGRYFARLVVPKELRPFIGGKTELRSPSALISGRHCGSYQVKSPAAAGIAA